MKRFVDMKIRIRKDSIGFFSIDLHVRFFAWIEIRIYLNATIGKIRKSNSLIRFDWFRYEIPFSRKLLENIQADFFHAWLASFNLLRRSILGQCWYFSVVFLFVYHCTRTTMIDTCMTSLNSIFMVSTTYLYAHVNARTIRHRLDQSMKRSIFEKLAEFDMPLPINDDFHSSSTIYRIRYVTTLWLWSMELMNHHRTNQCWFISVNLSLRCCHSSHFLSTKNMTRENSSPSSSSFLTNWNLHRRLDKFCQKNSETISTTNVNGWSTFE